LRALACDAYDTSGPQVAQGAEHQLPFARLAHRGEQIFTCQPGWVICDLG
jgi:hypothetical protein